jgi:hypothetical protein
MQKFSHKFGNFLFVVHVNFVLQLTFNIVIIFLFELFCFFFWLHVSDKYFLAAGNASLCGRLCYELLRCCNSRLSTIRQESCAILYLLMRSNFEFTSHKGLTRVHLQVCLFMRPSCFHSSDLYLLCKQSFIMLKYQFIINTYNSAHIQVIIFSVY